MARLVPGGKWRGGGGGGDIMVPSHACSLGFWGIAMSTCETAGERSGNMLSRRVGGLREGRRIVVKLHCWYRTTIAVGLNCYDNTL